VLGLVVGAGVVAVLLLIAVLAVTRAPSLEVGEQAVGAHAGGVVDVCREGEAVVQLARSGDRPVVQVEVRRAHVAVSCRARQDGIVDAAREANFDRRRQVLVRDGRQIIAALIGPAGGGCVLGLVVGAGVVAVLLLIAVLAVTRALSLEVGDQIIGAHARCVVAMALRAPAARKRLVVGAGGIVFDTKVRPDAVTTGTSGKESVTASVCFVFPVDFRRAQIRWDGAERGRTPRDDEHQGAGEHRQDV